MDKHRKGVLCGIYFTSHIYFSISAVFLEKDNAVAELLERLVKNGKKLFLITNSGVNFV